jgi:hypothetical protein
MTWALRPRLLARGRLTLRSWHSHWLTMRERRPRHQLLMKGGVTPLPATNSRTATPPLTNDAGAGGVVGDVVISASPRVIDVDPITVRSGGLEEGLMKD